MRGGREERGITTKEEGMSGGFGPETSRLEKGQWQARCSGDEANPQLFGDAQRVKNSAGPAPALWLDAA